MPNCLEDHIYIPANAPDIPATAFDSIQRESILSAYNELNRLFGSFPNSPEQQYLNEEEYYLQERRRRLEQMRSNVGFSTAGRGEEASIKESQAECNAAKGVSLTEEQRQFIDYYFDFLVIALKMQRYKVRAPDDIDISPFSPFFPDITTAWRELVIKVFAEEFLDDFQYRDALARGDLWPILAWRKLFSPIKWLVVLLQTMLMLMYWGFTQLCEYLMYVVDYILSTVPTVVTHLLSVSLVVSLILAYIFFFEQTSLIIGSLVWIYYFFSSLWLFLSLCACPVNMLIRPLATVTGLSPLLLSAISLSYFTVVLFYAAQQIVWTMSLAVMLQLLNPILYVYSLYILFDYFWLLYEKEYFYLAILVGLFMSTFLTFTCIAFTMGPVDGVLMQAVGWLFIGALISVSNVLTFCINEDKFKEHNREFLPLPIELVPEEIRSTTLLASKTATRSHILFNTPADAEYIPPKKRTWLQISSSFFGKGEKPKTDLLEQPWQEREAVAALGVHSG